MTYVYIDTETTGLDPDRHEVWEIAYAVDDGPIHQALVPHSAASADPRALQINGYFDRRSLQLNGYRMQTFPESDGLLWEMDLRDALTCATIVASNPSFDTAFLRKRWGVEPWHHRKIDISTYALPLYGEMLGLARIAERLEVEAPDHTAEQDVRTLRACYRALERTYAAMLHA